MQVYKFKDVFYKYFRRVNQTDLATSPRVCTKIWHNTIENDRAKRDRRKPSTVKAKCISKLANKTISPIEI